MLTPDPAPFIEAAIESVEDHVEAVEDVVEEIKEDVAAFDLDDLAGKVADRVYDKMKVLIGDLIEAEDDAAAIALAAAPAPATEEAAAEPDEEEQQDVKPKTGHSLFKKPMKKKD